MAWVSPSTRVTGTLITAAIWNQDVVANPAFLAAFGCAGTAFSAMTATTKLSRVAVGTYTGDGNDDRGITGIGFTPLAVFVKGDAALRQIVYRWGIAGDKSFLVDGASFANGIQSLDADGFTVGSDPYVNENLTVFYYLALG